MPDFLCVFVCVHIAFAFCRLPICFYSLRQLHSHLIRFSEHLLLLQNHNCICDSLNKPSMRIMPINVWMFSVDDFYLTKKNKTSMKKKLQQQPSTYQYSEATETIKINCLTESLLLFISPRCDNTHKKFSFFLVELWTEAIERDNERAQERMKKKCNNKENKKRTDELIKLKWQSRN